MSVTLTQTRVRPDDAAYSIVMIGINYDSNRVIVRIKFQSGDTQDIIYEGPRLAALRSRVSNFNGLLGAMESDVAANESGLGGSAS